MIFLRMNCGKETSSRTVTSGGLAALFGNGPMTSCIFHRPKPQTRRSPLLDESVILPPAPDNASRRNSLATGRSRDNTKSPDGNVIHRQSTLRHHLQISIAERVSPIPLDSQNDNL